MPSKSATAPTLVPSIITFANGIGSLLISVVIVPFIMPFCAKMSIVRQIKKIESRENYKVERIDTTEIGTSKVKK